MNRQTRVFSIVLLSIITLAALGAHAQTGSDKIMKAIETPFSKTFENVHLGDICEFISDTYQIIIVMDNRVVAPRDGEVRTAASTAEYASDGMIQYVNLKNVPLAEALRAILSPLGLTYSVQSSFIWISTPENIRHESFEDLETRVYDLPQRNLPDVNADPAHGPRTDLDVLDLLHRILPEIREPQTGNALSYLRYNDLTKQIVVHTTPSNHVRIDKLLESLFPAGAN